MSTAGHITNHRGSHTEALRATLCAPATLASALGNLAAVYARFALFPGGAVTYGGMSGMLGR